MATTPTRAQGNMSTSAPQGPYTWPQPPRLDPMIVTTKQVPHRCPVCEGRGHVPAGFYTGGLAEGANPEPCRSCKDGLIWVTETTTGRV